MEADSEARIVEAVREARERRRTLEIVGGGTRRAFGRPARCDDLLDVSANRGIASYEPEELIVTLKPGTPLTEIERVLSEKGQRLGFDPVDWSALLGSMGASTVGGAISSDACGSAAMRFGRARDHLLGFRAVNGFGEAYKAGGKVVKNVTGFDLPKLMCGAMGTLGVLSEVTFRVFPKSPLSSTFALQGLDAREGFALLRKVWSSPLDATGLAFADGTALVRLEGEKHPLAEKIAMLRMFAAGFEEIENGDARFRAIGNGAAFVATPFDVWLLSLPPAQAARVALEIDAPLWLGDRAGQTLWIGASPGDLRSIERLCVASASAGGHATLLRADERSRARIAVFAPEEPARAALTRAVKTAFDPLALLNPGRMYEGI